MGKRRAEPEEGEASFPGTPACDRIFLGMSLPVYISATIFIFVVWDLEISQVCLSYFLSQIANKKQKKNKKTWGWNPPFSSEFQIQVAHLYLWVVLFYLCHSLKSLLGPHIVLCTEVAGFLSVYSDMAFDLWTVFNMKSYKSPRRITT